MTHNKTNNTNLKRITTYQLRMEMLICTTKQAQNQNFEAHFKANKASSAHKKMAGKKLSLQQYLM